MTLAAYFASIAALHAGMLFMAFRLRAGVPEWLLRLLLAGLLFDNFMLAVSPLVFDNSAYFSLSRLRYLAHVLLLPPLTIAAVFVAGRAGIGVFASRSVRLAALLFAAAAITYGITTEIVGLQLVPEVLLDHRRYVSADTHPPLATIATNIAILLIAAAIWRKAAWAWLLAGAATIFVVNGAMAGSNFGIVAGNLAEVVFAACWLATLRRFPPGGPPDR